MAAEEQILSALQQGSIENSRDFAGAIGVGHEEVVGVLTSLEQDSFVTLSTISKTFWTVSAEGLSYAENGTPEYLLWQAVPSGDEGATAEELQSRLGAATYKDGINNAMREKWLRFDKNKRVLRGVDSIEDVARAQLKQLHDAGTANTSVVEKKALDILKRRKLIAATTQKSFVVKKGEQWALQRKKAETDITLAMINSGSWKEETFKAYNFKAEGKPLQTGALHPLMKVREQYRHILLEMGFEEMPTNQWVESSFWNFDALFQPQQHPARDMHDTFFLKDPAVTKDIPSDYMAIVKEMHEIGGFDSIGYRYDWKEAEARKNILRTHTTAVSTRMLFKWGQEMKAGAPFTPKRYFSIDRVFRNEAMDATHLAEFHQIEGLVADRNLGLSDLMGQIQVFFEKIGITQLRYKPAYNPYTEPSMEIFGFHPDLRKWVEVGNSGIFRPEMLRPMGLPEDISVIAWGLSLERPTMIMYNVSNIRDLFGHKVKLEMIKKNPITRVDV
jgi:phenylalanyl-tRNA synthetase alpha chain